MKVIVTQRAKYNLLDLFDYNANISLHYAIRIIYFISEKENTIFIRYIFSTRQDKKLFLKCIKVKFMIFLINIYFKFFFNKFQTYVIILII